MKELDCAILRAIHHLDANAYGTTIYRHLAAQRGAPSFGALYVALERLTEQGYVVTRPGRRHRSAVDDARCITN